MAEETQDPVSQPEAPASLESQLTAATADPVASTPAPSPDATPTSDGTTVTPAEPSWQGVRDYARSRGVELPFKDDAAALESLLTAYGNAGKRDYYADLGRGMAPHAQKIQQYFENQQRAAAAPQAPPAYEPPEFNKAWVAQVELDEATGLLRAKAGYDPAIAEKVNAFKQWRDEFMDNPAKVLKPMVEDRAQVLIEQKFAQYQQQSVAQDIIRAHSAWMYAADAQGRPQLTPEGAVYAGAVQQYAAVITDPRQLDAVATMAVQNAVYRQKAVASAPPAASAAVAPGFSAASVGGPNTRPGSSAPAAPAVSQRGMSLREMLQVNVDRAKLPEAVSW